MPPPYEIIIGSPGCGKTTTLLSLVTQELSNGTDPERIAYVTFTRKAAQEAVSRAGALGYPQSQLPWFRTLHSLCFAVLGIKMDDVFERFWIGRFAKWGGFEISVSRSNHNPTLYIGSDKGDRLLMMENMARLMCKPLRDLFDDDDKNLLWFELEHFERCLKVFKKEHGLLDYSDMLQGFLDSSWIPEIDVLLVDEAQDLGKLQWKVVERLALKARRVVVAGDDDQAIYRWAGASVDHFIDLPGQVRVLEQSYRVPVKIQELANHVIKRVYVRRPKVWDPRQEQGEVVWSKLEDVDFTGPDILVLSRNTKFLTKFVEPVLKSKGIVYSFRSLLVSAEPTLVRVILDWERLRRGEPLTVAQIREVYFFLDDITYGYRLLKMFNDGDLMTMKDLVERGGLRTPDVVWHKALLRIPVAEKDYILAALKSGESFTAKPRVRLSTIHTAKGGEADHVVLLTDIAKKTWKDAKREPDDEARVWYVGITRARRKLTLVEPLTGKNYPL